MCTPCLLSGALFSPFAVLSSAYFGDAVTDHVFRGSVLFLGFPEGVLEKAKNALGL